MRAAKDICTDLEDIAFRYERLTALIDIVQESEAESASEYKDERINSALFEILIALDENNKVMDSLLSELNGILKVQGIKNGKD